MKNEIQDRVRRSYQSGYEAGKKASDNSYPDGVDWHIIGTRCEGCGEHQVIPVADNAGEDINLYERLGELRRESCGCGSKTRRVFYEDGNMCSKKEGWKSKS